MKEQDAFMPYIVFQLNDSGNYIRRQVTADLGER